MSADVRWVACSISEFGDVGEMRHLIRTGSLVTKCGHSASREGIWRGNSTKPMCHVCEEVER